MNMKKTIVRIASGMAVVIASVFSAQAQNAFVQVIHNCADPAADTVDVWVNNTPAVPNFVFRKATGFIPVPAGVALTVDIKGPGSAAADPAVFTTTLGPLVSGQNYVVIASGVLDTTQFAANPGGADRSFKLNVLTPAQTASSGGGKVAIQAFHGITDASPVNINVGRLASLAQPVINGLSYGNFASQYNEVDTHWYFIVPAPLPPFFGDLSILGGRAITVFASGFLAPASNQNGAAAGLFAALPSGTVVALTPRTLAGPVQVVHNASDPALDTVDVWLNGAKIRDNIAYRTSLPYQTTFVANYPYDFAFAPKTSTQESDAIARFRLYFGTGVGYNILANGVANPGNFAVNPNSINTAFDLFVDANARTTATNATDIDIKVVHGVTDAPKVDIVAVNVPTSPTVVDNAPYRAFTPYISVPASAPSGGYQLAVKDETGATTIVTYTFNPKNVDGAGTDLTGQTVLAMASGFLTPSANQNGPAFGIFIVDIQGNVFPLSALTSVNQISGDNFGMLVYPNPSAEKLSTRLNLTEKSVVSISLFDLNGREVKSIASGTYEGNQTFTADLSDVANGVYTARVMVGNSSAVQKVIVNK